MPTFPSARAPGLPPFPVTGAALVTGIALNAGLSSMFQTVLPEATISRFMLEHILLMNVIAPAMAFLMYRFGYGTLGRGGILVPAVAQMALLWLVHAPPVIAVIHGHGFHSLIGGALLSVALWFWLAVFSQSRTRFWAVSFALLLSAKIFCLLGILLVFAPHAIYADSHVASGPAAALADQQLAGLLMLAICPVTYISAAIGFAANWLVDLEKRAPWPSERDALTIR